MKAASLATVALLVAAPAAAEDHAAEVDAFASLLADARTAAEQCADLEIDQARLAAEKDRLHIADVDYFAFRKKARDLADAISAGLNGDDAIEAWCAEAMRRYGPHGTVLADIVRR